MTHALAGVAILLLPLAHPDKDLLEGAWEMISDKTHHVKAYTQIHPITSPAYLVFDGRRVTSSEGDETEEAPYAALAFPADPGRPTRSGLVYRSPGEGAQPGGPWAYSIAGDELTLRIRSSDSRHMPWKERVYRRVHLR